MSARIYPFQLGVNMKNETVERGEQKQDQLRLELHKEIKDNTQELRAEIRENTAELRADIRENTQQLRSEMKAIADRLDGEIKATATRLEGEIKSAATRLEGEIKTTSDRLEGQIHSTAEQLRSEMKQMQAMQEMTNQRLDHQHQELSAKFDQLSADVKNIISWKDKAIGLFIAVNTLITTGATLWMLVHSLS